MDAVVVENVRKLLALLSNNLSVEEAHSALADALQEEKAKLDVEDTSAQSDPLCAISDNRQQQVTKPREEVGALQPGYEDLTPGQRELHAQLIETMLRAGREAKEGRTSFQQTLLDWITSRWMEVVGAVIQLESKGQRSYGYTVQQHRPVGFGRDQREPEEILYVRQGYV